ncbi:DHHC zinc finger domain containing protein [Entamoeba histolytica HM-1:IMSS-B]|uniref:Palmitoyltransferase n=6 Tax=Entamoeba histolytica TaxID=5759 RepID=C4M1V5_ENTH1|nr:zinc finger protein, putative [Entamoeba histolytica HM-1:IMSS]EMD44345.1 zinc finger protein, putative [Entamoeba histolytica KU27]EMH77651.1 DHHC zinc finger domain containing protein [Entamoeba histolytica HM-1:IMSS-B]EMS12623.1 zinc finger protein containing protein [Entamoeba histolytica HM-3:IMSS]ENY60956.1 zinc finger protein, putative [Entamoeba histolytica HM-1:IMSS-A]GAT95223.1 hypothetical protein conserved domain containing [Entamoeba histolytica]|eukprot:XP_657554.1 zinc finger protein, putative [Entamoeba histolytica HM-1:IMSS]
MIENIDYYYPNPKPKCPEGYDIEEIEAPDSVYIVVSKVLMYGVFVLTTIGTVQTYFGNNLIITIGDMIGLLLFILLTYCHYKVIHTSPGIVQNYIPVASQQELNEAIERVKKGNLNGCKTCDICYRVRWCSKCEKFRPPRSYHCKKCGYCIEKRDHHCPWVSNCIGKNNMKFFVQFIFYSSSALLLSSIINGFSIFHAVIHYDLLHGSFNWSIITLIVPSAVGMAIGLALFAGMLVLLINYLISIMHNETSMESIEIARLLKINKGKRDLVFENIPSYDRGVFNNIKETMGPTILDWFIPSQRRSNELEL